MTNDEWILGFQVFMVVLLIVGLLVLYVHDIKVDHQHCIQHGGQWVHGIGSDGGPEYYCIEPAGM